MKQLTEPNPLPLSGGPTLRWGIQAPGVIAGQFVNSLRRFTDQPVAAVASRSADRAEEFARTHAISSAYGTYEQLLDDPEVDIVYVASPHSHHCDMAVAALQAGKHVLVEKPLAVTAAEGERIRDASVAAGRFAMEAMHYRFHPRIRVLDALLRSGELGDICMVTADMGVPVPVIHDHRLFNPKLAGGTLLDMGVYSIWIGVFVLGLPSSVACFGHLTETGVDNQAVTIMSYAGGQQAIASSSLTTFGSGLASISGTEGRVLIHSRHSAPGNLSVFDAKNQPVAEFVDESRIVTAPEGLCRQAVWAARHVADGLIESPYHPLSTSIGVLRIIDEARAQVADTGAPQP